MSFKFEKLIVWQKAVELAADVHDLTRAFPKEELFILTAQIKRAADSVSLNIAEGSTGQSNAEFNKFLGYALRSNIEVVGCLFLAQKRNMIEPDDFTKLYHQCEEILAMLNALRKTLKEKIKPFFLSFGLFRL
ncbi:four helix bundle protein, partial [Mucilaginibacter gotjawali]